MPDSPKANKEKKKKVFRLVSMVKTSQLASLGLNREEVFFFNEAVPMRDLG